MPNSDRSEVLAEYLGAISVAEAKAVLLDGGDRIGRVYMDLFWRVKELVLAHSDLATYLDDLSDIFDAFVGDADTAALYILRSIAQHHDSAQNPEPIATSASGQ